MIARSGVSCSGEEEGNCRELEKWKEREQEGAEECVREGECCERGEE
jgi:hypothetical protein